MKRLMTSLSLVAPIAGLLLLAPASKVFGDEHDQKTTVTISEAMQVPGAVLPPGTYMFILLNSTDDRHIVEVKSPDGKRLYSMSFATAAQRVFPTDKVALSVYETPKGSAPALRQWFTPGERQGQEFLYSHQQASEIMAVNHQTVPEMTDKEAAALAARMAQESAQSGK
jgi:hypothetical protein